MGGGTFLDIVAKSHIDGVMVLGYVAIDVAQTSIADLDVDLAPK